MILFVAWRDTSNTNSNSCNMKESLWWPNYMPNVLGIDLLGSKCSPYNGMETICSIDKHKPRLHCCWWGHLMEWFYAQTCAFVLHNLVTLTVNTRSLCHLSRQQCPPMQRAHCCHIGCWDFRTTVHDFKPWVNSVVSLLIHSAHYINRKKVIMTRNYFVSQSASQTMKFYAWAPL